MALRSKTTSNIAIAGTQIAHGLATTPDEVTCLATLGTSTTPIYRFSASDATSVYIAVGSAATSADVIMAVNHSLVR